MSRGARARLLLIAASIASICAPAAAQQTESSLPTAQAPPQHSGQQAVYLGGPNCPDEAAFWDQVDAHRQDASSLGTLVVRVEVFEREGGAQAKIMLGATPTVVSTRELSAPSCREVAAAAALVVALALDAHLNELKLAASAPPRSAEPPPPEPPPPEPPRRPSFPDAAKTSPGKESGLDWELGAGAFAQQAIAPSPMLGGTAFAGIGDDETPWTARLGFVYAASGTTQQSDASAEFSLLAGRLEGCAFAILESDRFLIDPCLAVELGAVGSSGVSNLRYSSEERSSFWAAGGPLVRLRYAFGPLWLELFGGPWIPFAGTREFVFEDPPEKRSFYAVPPVGWAGGLRVSLHGS